ncbi:MAG: hypothetical protein ACRC8Y_20425 [Chroococcales cyanobacterium]
MVDAIALLAGIHQVSGIQAQDSLTHANMSGKSSHGFSLATTPLHNLTANGLDKIIFVRYFSQLIEINPQ